MVFIKARLSENNGGSNNEVIEQFNCCSLSETFSWVCQRGLTLGSTSSHITFLCIEHKLYEMKTLA